MNKLQINFENCYGIKKLQKEFDFSNSRTFAIYAPNGVMKTSFAKAFIDLRSGTDSKDLIFPDRITLREIKREDGSDVTKEEVFVVEPYNENFNSDRMSTLLANKTLKSKYDEIHLKIDKEKETLLKELKTLSGLRDDIENEISKAFTNDEGKLFISLERVEKEVIDSSKPEFSDISYKEISNEKVIKFLETKDFKEKIVDYIKKYDELIEKSKYFRKGVFNHNNASAIAKSLVDNGFFKARHSVSLNAKESKGEMIHTKEELENVIEAEKNAILTNPDLVKAFAAIDDKLNANKELRDFRNYLLEHVKIITELKSLASLKQKIWISYLKERKDLYTNMLKEYRQGKDALNKIIEQAKTEETQWREVISIFNKRFSVPFVLTIKNQDDVILEDEIPSISFVFKDSSEEKSVERLDLLQALSSGEKKALYILNIIFEVEARKKDMQETLFIVDDIADSFDYKNKYAIIQYLKEISEESLFYQIILTHNFDFFRTIHSREVVDYPRCLFSYKTENEVKLEPARGVKNPFINDWKLNLSDSKKLVASIPFVRNIVEYTKGERDADYKKLTSLLHWKNDSESFLMSDLELIFKNSFTDAVFPETHPADKIIDKIFREAENCLSASEGVNFENKIVLSIAIRLKAEKFMIDKINDQSFVSAIVTKQTTELFKKYKEKCPLETENIQLLADVNLMTPENIHLNSFMYEPILDMSDQHLRDLYKKVKSLS